jgi:hypothetical protein
LKDLFDSWATLLSESGFSGLEDLLDSCATSLSESGFSGLEDLFDFIYAENPLIL